MSPDANKRDENWPWGVLDLPGPVEEREVKRAYARRLKAIDRTDVAAFEALRSAFDAARKAAQAAGGVPKTRARPDMASLAAAAGSAQRPAPSAQPPVAPDEVTEPPKPKANHPKETLSDAPVPKAAVPRPTVPLPTPAEASKPLGAERMVLPSHAPDQTSDTQNLVTEVISPKIIAAVNNRDAATLSTVLEIVEGLDRRGQAQCEAAVIRALHADPTRLTHDIALAIDAVFDWSEDAFETQRKFDKTVGRSDLYSGFFGALRTQAQKEATAVEEGRFEPAGVMLLLAIALVLIQVGLETWGAEENQIFTFFIVLVSTLFLLFFVGFFIAAPLVLIRWLKRRVFAMTSPESALRQKMIDIDLWFTERRIDIFAIACGLSIFVFFGYAWIVSPFLS